MNDLRSSDLDSLLAAVEFLRSPEETLPERILNALDHVVPNDLIAIDSFADSELVLREPIHWDNEPARFTPAIAEACEMVFETAPFDNPLVVEQVHRRSEAVLKLSDFRGQAAFRNSAYFNEILRPLELDRQMGVMLKVAPDLRLGCAINRKGPDFTERERGIVALLAPHLAGAVSLEMEKENRRIVTRRLSGVLEAASSTVVLSASGEVLEMPEASRRLIAKYFDDGVRDPGDLPKPLAEWLSAGRTQRSGTSAMPALLFDRDLMTLRVTASETGENGEILLLLTEKQKLSPAMMEALGLTPRQAEVLYWMSLGKSDEIIGELLGASPRTIQKHAEHIFTKLGVESRTSAAVAAIERLIALGHL